VLLRLVGGGDGDALLRLGLLAARPVLLRLD